MTTGRTEPFIVPGVAPEVGPADPNAARLASGATGVLRTLNESDVLDAADVHVAIRLAELVGESDELMRLTAALAVRGVRTGSVCVDLETLREVAPVVEWPDADTWERLVLASPLVGDGRPLHWHDGLLYLERYWRQETAVCVDLLGRATAAPPGIDESRLAAALERLFPGPSWADQRVAAEVAATHWVTVLGGGPGTGKTTTVARLLAVIADATTDVVPRPLRIAVAAPTGKAAARLYDAITEAAGALDADDADAVRGIAASTIHRLLGWRPGGRFRHDATNRLPYDVVVVDETSMVSLTLMADLLAAIRSDTRLVLVGDPDQLASIEAGAVLADIVSGLRARAAATGDSPAAGEAGAGAVDAGDPAAHDPAPHDPAPNDPAANEAAADDGDPIGRGGVVLLRHTWRFRGAIAELATAIRTGATEDALDVLDHGGAELELIADTSATGSGGPTGAVAREIATAAGAVRAAAEHGDAPMALGLLTAHQVLCAHNSGSYGVDHWNAYVERLLSAAVGEPLGTASGARRAAPYAGCPVLVTANDYALGLFNGDTGVVVRAPDATLRIAFTRAGATSFATFAPARLSDVITCHAMTVHRAQGSQFDRVTLVLPPPDSMLTTRELLYTAVTRARTRVRVLGTRDAVAAAIERPAVRASGLRQRLAAPPLG